MKIGRELGAGSGRITSQRGDGWGWVGMDGWLWTRNESGWMSGIGIAEISWGWMEIGGNWWDRWGWRVTSGRVRSQGWKG